MATATSAEPRAALPESLTTKLTKIAKQSKRSGDATVRVVLSTTGTITTADLTPLRPSGQVQHATGDAERRVAASVLHQAAGTRPACDSLPPQPKTLQVRNQEAALPSPRSFGPRFE
ncbi:hypothetical protein [Nocardia xishanensis]